MKYLCISKIFILSLLFSACSGPEQSEQEKLRELNAKGEFIYRNSDEKFYTPEPLERRTRENYPWEETKR